MEMRPETTASPAVPGDLIIREPGTLSFGRVFQADRPVILDIGCARGHYAVALALAHPNLSILGADYKQRRVMAAARRVEEAGAENVRLVCDRAERLFAERLEPASVLAAFFVCPDPWPKRRHHRRRLLQPPFISLLRRALAHRGAFFFKTDDPGYLEATIRVMDSTPAFEPIDCWEAGGFLFDPSLSSEYEDKHRAQGRETHALAWRAC